MTLTEQWKKGELENDWYYIRTTNGIEKWEYIKQSHGFGYYETEWVLEVLAPVPSYDHFVELTEKVKENQQLKELLKECREASLDYGNHSGNYELYDRIDEVLK